MGKNVREIYPDAVGSKFHTAYHRAMDDKIAVNFEASYSPHDRWSEHHAYQSSEGISVYFRDIGERKRAEQDNAKLMAASEKQRRLYKTALSSTPDFNYILDLEGQFI